MLSLAILHRVDIWYGFHRYAGIALPGEPHALAQLQRGLLNVVRQGIGPSHVRQVVAVRVGGGVAAVVAGVNPVRLAEHDPGLWFRERIGIAVHGLALEGDGGERNNRREFQLQKLPPGPCQSLYDGALGEDPVAEPSNGVAASLDNIAEQRIVCDVGDAEDRLEVRQSDELGGAGER